jgi:hypothetical protein
VGQTGSASRSREGGRERSRQSAVVMDSEGWWDRASAMDERVQQLEGLSYVRSGYRSEPHVLISDLSSLITAEQCSFFVICLAVSGNS